MLRICIAICLCCWVFCAAADARNSDSYPNDLTLVKTIVLFRHGKRAPLNPFEFDIHAPAEEVYWPEGYGTLVQDGKEQMYKLGEQLRARYHNFLLPYGNTVGDDVKVVTTAVDRCYLSAALLLAGFYPPDEKQVWNNQLLWQPVPILYTSPDKVHIIGKKEKCAAYHEELLKVYKLKQDDSNVNYLINYLANFTHPVTITNAHGLFLVGDYLRTKRSLNLKLPKWADDDFLRRLDEFYDDSFKYLVHTEKMKKLLAGPLIKDLVHRVQEAVYNENTNSKFYFYSGHDSSLISLFHGLKLEANFVPTYGASFIFEVYRSSSNNYLIKILFSEDYSLTRLNVKVLPDCEEYCPVGKFVRIFDEYVAQDWESECNDVSV